MLAKSVVKKFRARQLESYRWMKRLKLRELHQMIRDLNPQPQFISKKKMWKHQLVAFLVGVYIGHFLFFLDMGLGKTRVILEIIAYRKLCSRLKGALVLVPYSAAVEGWVMEAEEHRPDLKCVPMYGSSKERRRLLQSEGDLFVISYMGLIHMCCTLKETRVKRRIVRKLEIDKRKLRTVAERFSLICLDESTEIMNHRSLTFRVCKQLGALIENRYGMAGIPLGRDPQALWSQFYFCDRGETLGETLGLFREAFFTKKDNHWTGWHDFVFDKKNTKLLNRTLQNRSIHYDESECRDVPKIMRNPVYVPFTDDMKAYYNKIIDQLKADRKSRRLTKNSFLQMRQIASGFIGIHNDVTGQKAEIEFPENPKMEALRQILQQIPEGRKFLIFHQYIWTGNRISQELKNLKIKHVRLRGGQKDGPAVYRKFKEDPSIPGFVISNECGAFALNLQVANYEIFVESPVSPIIRGQAEKRLRPALQKRRCIYMDIIMHRNTADENIQKFLQEGRNIESSLMRGDALKLRKV